MTQNSEKFELDSKSVLRRFERAAAGFDGADFAHRNIGDGLMQRLEPVTLDPGIVLDLGCGTGAMLATLKKRFRGSRVIGIDRSPAMLARAKARGGWLSRQALVQADATALPFADHCSGLVFANLLLPWLPQPDPLFREAGRVLRRDGLFAFSTLGPDSLAVLADAFGDASVHGFADMHDIGDGLVRSGLRDPVLDVDRLTIRYATTDRLFADLAGAAARNSLRRRAAGLTGRRRFAAAVAKLDAALPIEVELEIVYGHAWGSGQSGDAIRVDAGSIPRRRR